MAPVAVGGDFLSGVIAFVDPHALGAELDVPVAGGAHVERHHLVVGVPAQRRGQLEAVRVDAVERLADGVEGVDLHHEVDRARVVAGSARGQIARLWWRWLTPRNRTRIGAELRRRGHAERAAGLESQYVGVELEQPRARPARAAPRGPGPARR